MRGFMRHSPVARRARRSRRRAHGRRAARGPHRRCRWERRRGRGVARRVARGGARVADVSAPPPPYPSLYRAPYCSAGRARRPRGAAQRARQERGARGGARDACADAAQPRARARLKDAARPISTG